MRCKLLNGGFSGNLMSNHKPQSSFIRAIRKFFLSAFVVVTFIAYALENRSAKATTGGELSSQAVAPITSSENGSDQNQTAQTAPSKIASAQKAAPTETPVPSQLTSGSPAQIPNTPAQAVQNGLYKNGTYTGPAVDVDFGFVQVQAVIQNGKIANVQFLEYPQDRRTSQRINSFAVPTLQREAVQAQSANVDLVSGATLTSEGFQQSLQTALNQASNVQ